jgi:hypothetical protein
MLFKVPSYIYKSAYISMLHVYIYIYLHILIYKYAYVGKYFIHLAVEKPCDNINQTSLPVNVICYRPVTGVFEKSRYELDDKYVKTSISDAKIQWEMEFNDARDNNPEKMSYDYNVLGGAILPEWGFIERALNRTLNSDTSAPMRVARATIAPVQKGSSSSSSSSSSRDADVEVEPISIIGLHIPSNKIEYILEALRAKEEDSAAKLINRAAAAANFVDASLGMNNAVQLGAIMTAPSAQNIVPDLAPSAQHIVPDAINSSEGQMKREVDGDKNLVIIEKTMRDSREVFDLT